MNIETVEDLANIIADWMGIYGCCKSDGDHGCELDRSRPFCCRMGFMGEIEERIRQAVRNEESLKELNLK